MPVGFLFFFLLFSPSAALDISGASFLFELELPEPKIASISDIVVVLRSGKGKGNFSATFFSPRPSFPRLNLDANVVWSNN